jgi:hypothetical protein
MGIIGIAPIPIIDPICPIPMLDIRSFVIVACIVHLCLC